MYTDLHLAKHVSDEDGYEGSDWYINKCCRSIAVKVLHSSKEGLCKTRLMEDILRGQLVPDERQAIPDDDIHKSSCGSANAKDPGFERVSDLVTDNRTSLAETDDDDEMGKMTLKEMHSLLRQVARKTAKEKACVLSSSVSSPEADSDSLNKGFECSAQLGILELHLDSSTSNSAESGDDLSPHFVATSCQKPIDIVSSKCEDWGPELSVRKQTSFAGSLLPENGFSVEDDECTLQVWQAHRQRLRGGKRSGGRAVEQDGTLICASTQSSVALSFCNMNYAFDAAELDESVVTGVRCASGETSGSLTPCPIDDKESLEIDEYGLVDGGLDLKETLKETSKDSIDSFINDGEECCLIGTASNPCMLEGSLVGRNPGENSLSTQTSWAIRPCKVFDGSKFEDMEVEINRSPRTTEEPIAPCMMTRESGENQVPAVRCPALLETQIKVDNEASIGSSAVQSTIPYPQVIGTAMKSFEHVENRINDPFRKSSSMDLAMSPRCEDSPNFLEPKLTQATDGNSTESLVTVSQSSCEQVASPPVWLPSGEYLDVEDDQDVEPMKPSKIPCKRKAISPLSRERLLQASKSGGCERTIFEVEKRGLKKLPRAFKGFIGRDPSNYENTDSNAISESSPPEKLPLKSDVLPGSPCHNRKKVLCGKSFAPKVSIPASYGDFVASTTATSASLSCEPIPSCMQKLSLVLNSSPSPTLRNIPTPIHGKSPTNLSPSIPTKGILRSSPPTCRGACKCEECESLRCRAERAAEFSQRQMHDIEGLVVRLLKELNSMRCVVEESLIQRTASRVDGPHSASSSEQMQARRAASNALEAEKMAKSWLVRMARDCNRYCKIMRMQERKLTFADESGGQLCQIKVFHPQSKPQKYNKLLNPGTENMAASPSCDGNFCSETELETISS